MKRKLYSLALLALLLPLCACWVVGPPRSGTRKFIDQLDTNSIAAREAQLALKQMLDLKLLAPPTARGIGETVESFRAANRELIDLTDQPGFKTVNEQGQVVISFTAAGKSKAEVLATALSNAAVAIINNKTLFTQLSEPGRASLTALVAAASNTTRSIIGLVGVLKSKPGTVSVVLDGESVKTLNHAKGVAADVNH